MPLINGIKMACEPCIRGHRSTKCTHAHERVMVPVRKPGRPLSACPHPNTRSCSCSTVVTAAIPRKQSCHCGPSHAPSATTPSSGQDLGVKIEPKAFDAPVSPESGSPTTPSPAAAPPHRVTKSVSKSTSRRGKQALDASALQRMDPAHLNVRINGEGSHENDTSMHLTQTPTTNGSSSNQTGTSTNDSNSSSSSSNSNSNNHVSTDPSPKPGVAPIGSQPIFVPLVPPPIQLPPSAPVWASWNGLGAPPANGHYAMVYPVGNGDAEQSHKLEPRSSSCCGAKEEIKPVSSCCSKPADQSETRSSTSTTPWQTTPNLSSAAMTPVTTPGGSGTSGFFPFYGHPTVFAYPPNFGSYMQPLQFEQWQQMMMMMMSNSAVAQQHQQQQQLQHQQHQQHQMTTSGPPIGSSHPTMQGSGTSLGTIHECGCGEGCQCLGCAAHPYNEVTQDYVRSAYASARAHVKTNGKDSHSATNGEAASEGSSHPTTSASDSVGHENTTGSQPLSGDKATPTYPQTPSEGLSTIQEEQALPENDFFFVSYPFEGSCEGDSAGCPCGDDCACIGCTIHNNPVAT